MVAENATYDDYNSTYRDYNGTINETYDEQFPPPPPPLMYPPLYHFRKYAYPITIAFGIVGNSFIFYIFTRTKLKKPSTSRYLAAASIADSGFLCTTLFTNLFHFHDVAIESTVGPCQLIQFGNYVFTFLSTWYLTAVMVEKYVGVSWPRKKTRLCTVFRAKCVIICLAVLSIVCYLYITWFFGVVSYQPGKKICTLFRSDSGIRDAWNTLTRMDAIVNFAVPYIVIFVMSCLIAYRTWEYRKMSRSAGERFLRRQRITTPADKEFKTTPLLLLLAITTLVFCTPNNVSSMKRVFYSDKRNFRPTLQEMYIFAIFHYLYVLNDAMKIVVYIVASSAFVKEIIEMFCGVKRLLFRQDSGTASNELLENGCNNDTKTVATSTEGIV